MLERDKESDSIQKGNKSECNFTVYPVLWSNFLPCGGIVGRKSRKVSEYLIGGVVTKIIKY